MPIMETVARKKPRPRRSSTPEFKADIVERCRRGDRSIGEVTPDFDLTETAVREWVKQAEVDADPGRDISMPRSGVRCLRHAPDGDGGRGRLRGWGQLAVGETGSRLMVARSGRRIDIRLRRPVVTAGVTLARKLSGERRGDVEREVNTAPTGIVESELLGRVASLGLDGQCGLVALRRHDASTEPTSGAWCDRSFRCGTDPDLAARPRPGIDAATRAHTPGQV
jgi:transposase